MFDRNRFLVTMRQSAAKWTAAIAIALCVAVPVAQPVVAKEVKLKLISAWPLVGKVGERILTAKLFIKKFNQLAKGKAKIIVIGGPEVVSPFDQLKAIQDGQFDMMVTTSLYYKQLRGIQFYHYIPYDQQISRMKKGYKLVQEISKEDAKVVFVHLATPGLSFYVWTTKKPLRSVADAKGVKVRTFGDTTAPLQKHLGITPTSIPSNAVYTALQTGVLEGALRDTVSLDVLKEAKFLKYRTQFSVADIEGATFISARAWDALPKDVRKLMNQAGRWAEAKGIVLTRALVAKTIKKLQSEQGVKIVQADARLEKVLKNNVRRDILRKLVGNSKRKDQIIAQFGLEAFFGR